jgi:hypothetical protein
MMRIRYRLSIAALSSAAAMAFTASTALASTVQVNANWTGSATNSCSYSTTVYTCNVSATSQSCVYSGAVAGVTVSDQACSASLSGSWSGMYQDVSVFINFGTVVVETQTCSTGSGFGSVMFVPSSGLFSYNIPVTLSMSSQAETTTYRLPNGQVIQMVSPGTMNYSGSTASSPFSNAVATSGSFTFVCGATGSSGSFAGTLNAA